MNDELKEMNEIRKLAGLSPLEEGRDAPLYHWAGHRKLITVLEHDVLLGDWVHINPETNKEIKGTSLSRTKRFRWSIRNVRFVIDQNKLQRTHRIIPLDADLVAGYSFNKTMGSYAPIDKDWGEWRKSPNVPRTKTGAKGDVNTDFGEEFVLGDVKEFHQYLLSIDVVDDRERNGVLSQFKPSSVRLSEILGSHMAKRTNQYAKKHGVPIRFIPDIKSTTHLKMRESEFDNQEHEEALDKTGFWGKAGSGVMPMAASTGRILLPLRSTAVEQPHTWGGTWGGAIDRSQDPKESAIREFREESGYKGPIEMVPLYTFEDKNSDFRYFNFLGLIPEEFNPSLDWETDDYAWVEYGDWPSPAHFGLVGILNNQRAVKTIEKILRRLEEGNLENLQEWNISKIKKLSGLTEGIDLPTKELAAYYNVNTRTALGDSHITHNDIVMKHPSLFGLPEDISNWSRERVFRELDNNYNRFYEDGWIRIMTMREGRTIILGLSGYAGMMKTAWKQNVISQLIKKVDPDEVMVDIEYIGQEAPIKDALFELPSDSRKLIQWFNNL